jgi:hypothetical protein
VARYYDPSTGQFISRDPPVELTREPYGYAGDSPTNGSDRPGWASGRAYRRAVSGSASTFQVVQGRHYINTLSAAGNTPGDDYTRLHSGDSEQMVQPVLDAVTVAATVTSVYGLA